MDPLKLWMLRDATALRKKELPQRVLCTQTALPQHPLYQACILLLTSESRSQFALQKCYALVSR